MRIFWERAGVLGPVYRLAGQGLSDLDIANKLNLTEVKVADCNSLDIAFSEVHGPDRTHTVRFGSGNQLLPA